MITRSFLSNRTAGNISFSLQILQRGVLEHPFTQSFSSRLFVSSSDRSFATADVIIMPQRAFELYNMTSLIPCL